MNKVLELLRLPAEKTEKNVRMAKSTKCIERSTKTTL
jgi:hypothetical protein